ncbi:MAG: glycerate kinase [Anaerolineae bacterium]
MKTLSEMRADALAIFHTALAAADPRAAVLRTLKREGDTLTIAGQAFDISRGRVLVIGAGKADAPMAQAVEDVLGDRIHAGAVTVKYGYTAPTGRIKLSEAGHPLPDENGRRATRAALDLLSGLTADDLVLCLLSGGGSALFELLVAGVTLDDLRALTTALLKCGATINEINALRKHLSQVKGGQLARLAQPARVVSLILSDVLGSPLDVIASGPTAPDASTFSGAQGIIEKYHLSTQVPASIRAHLERGVRGEIPDTPKQDDPLFARVLNVIVADNESACSAALEAARGHGYQARLISTTVQGEAREVGSGLAQEAKKIRDGGQGLPACLIAGGETTVTIRGEGKGGRSQELALAAAIEMAGVERAVILSAGTDGTDGPTDADGAIADGTTLARAQAQGLDARRFLAANDSYNFFQPLGDLMMTGPTNTNVNDLMIVLIAS